MLCRQLDDAHHAELFAEMQEGIAKRQDVLRVGAAQP